MVCLYWTLIRYLDPWRALNRSYLIPRLSNYQPRDYNDTFFWPTDNQLHFVVFYFYDSCIVWLHFIVMVTNVLDWEKFHCLIVACSYHNIWYQFGHQETIPVCNFDESVCLPQALGKQGAAWRDLLDHFSRDLFFRQLVSYPLAIGNQGDFILASCPLLCITSGGRHTGQIRQATERGAVSRCGRLCLRAQGFRGGYHLHQCKSNYLMVYSCSVPGDSSPC